MNCVRRTLTVLAVLLLTIPANAQWNEEPQQARDSLKGLPGVVLKINYGSMDNWPDDPAEPEIQAEVAKRLQEAGIKLFNRALGETDDRPTLVVSFGFMNFDITYYSIEITAALRQKVKVLSQPNLSLTATTWQSRHSSLSAGTTKREQLARVVNHFICDFQQANPEPNRPSPKCNPNEVPDDGFVATARKLRAGTPLDQKLLEAVALNEVDDVKSLIAKGADVNGRDFADTTPITYAIRAYRKANDGAVITLLLKQGANPNLSGRRRLTPLMYAVERGDAKVVQLLLDHGADVNAATTEGFTALMAASALGFPEIVQLLLKKGANTQAQTHDGETALAMAKRFRDRIAASDRVDLPDSDRGSKLLKAAQLKHDQIVALLQGPPAQ